MKRFTYKPPSEQVRAMNWSNRSDHIFRLAVATRNKNRREEIAIIRFDPDKGIPPYQQHSIYHVVSANALAFFPSIECHHPDLLASAADILRLWKFTGRFIELKSELAIDPSRINVAVNTIEWNASAPKRIAAACFGGSCTVWDIERGTPEAQLFITPYTDLVHDVSWGGSDILAATFEEGNVKLVDLRSRQASPIYCVPRSVIKVDWNSSNTNYIAVTTGGNRVVLLDTRWPQLAMAEMFRHEDMIRSIAWDPVNPRRLCTAGEDSRALIWEVPAFGHDEVISEYVAGKRIKQMKWSWLQPAWVALEFHNELQIMEVVNANVN